MDKMNLEDKKLLADKRIRSNLRLTSLLSKERVSRLCSHSVSLMITLGIDASSGDKVFKTLICVNY